jgi:hypothetical protein
MIKPTVIAAFSIALLSACSDSGSGGGSGSFSLGVTDAPVDEADSVVVGFTAVELLDAEGGVALRFDLDETQQVDLLAQQGDNQFFLVQDEQIPAGVYEEVRLIVAEQTNASCNAAQANPERPSYITIDGTDFPLIVPSGGQTGLKVRGPLTIAAGGSAAYTVDFDLRKSIAERGATGCYNLRPVLRVVDNAQVGTLTGSVDPALLADSSCTADPVSGAGAAVYVYSGPGVTPDDFNGADPEPLTTALLQPEMLDGALVDFSYEVGFLLEGSYTVALSCQAGDDLPAPSDDEIAFIQPGDVEIIRDSVSEFDFTVVEVEVPAETTE